MCILLRRRGLSDLVGQGPRAQYTEGIHRKVLFSGVLTWLGLSQESESEHDLIITIKRGILAAQEGDLKRADQIFHVALKMANDIGHEEGKTHIFSLLANTALERGFIGQAERLFTEVLRRILANGEPQDSNAVVEISLKLADIFNRQNDLDKAEQGFEFCTKAQRSKVESEGKNVSEDTLALYGLVLDRRGQFLLAHGRLEEAKLSFAAAVQVSDQVHGEKHDQTLVIKNSLSTVLSLNGEVKKAIDLLSEIIMVSKETSCPHLSTFLINRGIVQLRAGMREAAEEDCREAAAQAEDRRDREAVKEAKDCLDDVLKLKNVVN